ncbi:uncharacterized protein LOC143460280 [Clavelina lepadiformis]|uniref:uncharacterized protein LOC143460280 n=1 Tax=Clavelina lepadiformis TaxID=159417 RepID=UPI0040428604
MDLNYCVCNSINENNSSKSKTSTSARQVKLRRNRLSKLKVYFCKTNCKQNLSRILCAVLIFIPPANPTYVSSTDQPLHRLIREAANVARGDLGMPRENQFQNSLLKNILSRNAVNLVHKVSHSEESFQDDNSEMSPAQKCRKIGYVNSAVCKFEFQAPQKAQQIFDIVRERLLLNLNVPKPPTTSLSDRINELRSIITYENSKHQENFPSTLTSTSSEILEETTIRQQPVLHREKRGTPLFEREVCPTKFELVKPQEAVHVRSGQLVSLYFYIGPNGSRGNELYTQEFEVGNCRENRPLFDFNISEAYQASCRRSMAKHLANFYLETAQADGSLVSKCQQVNETLSVCRDWVYLPSHCKLYTTARS